MNVCSNNDADACSPMRMTNSLNSHNISKAHWPIVHLHSSHSSDFFFILLVLVRYVGRYAVQAQLWHVKKTTILWVCASLCARSCLLMAVQYPPSATCLAHAHIPFLNWASHYGGTLMFDRATVAFRQQYPVFNRTSDLFRSYMHVKKLISQEVHAQSEKNQAQSMTRRL